MPTKCKLRILVAVMALCGACVMEAVAIDQAIYERNWPQWRGPTANGVAPHGNPPSRWSETENVRWKTPIPGEGHSTPIVWEDKVVLLTAVPQGETEAAAESASPASGRGRRGFGRGSTPNREYAFTTICLDRATGTIQWQKVGRQAVPHEGHQPTNTYASGSPVTDGTFLISYFGSYGLYCYDLDGRLQWQKDLGRFKSRNGFGEGSSPVLHGDKLIVLWDTEEDSYIYAFDKNSGRELWRQPRDERSGWTTPRIVPYKDRFQVVINGTNAVRSYDLESGKLLWSCEGQTANAIPSIVADEDTVYVMSGFRGNTAVAIELGATGNLTDTPSVRWKLDRGTPYVPSPLLYDEKLYFCQSNSAILSCVDARSGEPHFFRERLDGIASVYASPVGAAQRIYLPGREGMTLVMRHGPELEVLAANKLDAPIDSSPAIAGEELFLRSHHAVYCIAEN